MIVDDDNPIIQKYYELRQYLGFGFPDLDQQFERSTPIMEEAGHLAAEAEAIEMTARHTYEVIRAEAADRLRSHLVAGKEPSEARIDKLLPLEQDVQESRVAYEKARRDTAVCNVLFRSLEMQTRLLPKASDLVLAAWKAPSAGYILRLQEISEARFADQAARAREREGPEIGRPTE